MNKPEDARLFIGRHDDLWFAVMVGPEDELLGSAFSNDRHVLSHFSERFERVVPINGDHKLLRQMIRLYRGESNVETVKFNFDSLSQFQRRVYKILSNVPRGKVTSYGVISKAIESSPRAVGGAIGSNPFPLFLPCHRVVPSDMTIGNYSMNGNPDAAGSNVKKKILLNEDVRLVRERVDSSCLWKPRE